MAIYKSKFIEIDPETCTKEELHAAIAKMNSLSGYYETKQLAIKTFINSVYGATASKYFVGHNTAVAESITLQGQDLNHYSENCVNKYFRNVFQSDEEYNRILYIPIYEWMEKWDLNDTNDFYAKNPNTKEWILINLPVSKEDIKTDKLNQKTKDTIKKNVFVKTTFGKYLGITLEQAKSIDINRGRVTDQKPLNASDIIKNFKYLGKETYLEDDPSCSMAVAGDTDSCISSTKIYLDKYNITIEDAFIKCKYENKDSVLVLPNGQEIVPVNGHTTKSFNQNAPFLAIDSPIKYIMRHKVSKAKYKIKSKSGKEVIVTGDHSCMVIRNNKLLAIKAKDINPITDKLIEIVNHAPENKD